jgi:hypothetical protein
MNLPCAELHIKDSGGCFSSEGAAETLPEVTQ